MTSLAWSINTTSVSLKSESFPQTLSILSEEDRPRATDAICDARWERKFGNGTQEVSELVSLVFSQLFHM